MATNTTFSPAGTTLFGTSSPSLANPETEEERRKRMQAMASAQARLGTNSISAAGSLLGLGGYNTGI